MARFSDRAAIGARALDGARFRRRRIRMGAIGEPRRRAATGAAGLPCSVRGAVIRLKISLHFVT
ncbi:hypothetical protein GSH07_12365 [Burkholderia pseudomallei]|nr:hypothetical protein [Burkholderia pseudomallei]